MLAVLNPYFSIELPSLFYKWTSIQFKHFSKAQATTTSTLQLPSPRTIMAAKSINSRVLRSSQREGTCAVSIVQDGVCGCSQFWEPKQDSKTSTPSSTGLSSTNTMNSRESVPSASKTHGKSKAPCFFWYHGTCRRGNNCHLAHQLHIGWPITPPPNYMHYEPCSLPLCPLRADLVVLEQSQKNTTHSPQLDSQIDGTSPEAAIEISSGEESEASYSSDEKDASESTTHSESHTANQIESEIALSGSGLGNSEAGTVNVKASEARAYFDRTGTITSSFSSSLLNSSPTEGSDTTASLLSPSLANTNEESVLLLSQADTLRKRNRSVSPQNHVTGRDKRQKRTAEPVDSNPAATKHLQSGKQCTGEFPLAMLSLQ